MIPVRIIAACENGHIEDFPFRRWIGCTCPDDESARMFFKAGRSAASLAGIKIECSACGKSRSLAGAFEEDVLSALPVPCSGAQPWLGRDRAKSCSANLQTLQRGGSNVYFPAVESSIYIPPAHAFETDDIRRILDTPNFWSAISSGLQDGKINPTVGGAIATVTGVDATALIAAAQSG